MDIAMTDGYPRHAQPEPAWDAAQASALISAEAGREGGLLPALHALMAAFGCVPEAAEPLLDAMRSHPLGADSRIIGEVFTDDQCFVEMDTVLGGRRAVDWLAGDPLPRIC